MLNSEYLKGNEFDRVLLAKKFFDMSKKKEGKTVYEFLYEKGLLGFASGGCRPVLAVPFLEQAGFRDIQRIYRKNRSLFFMNWLTGTEIAIAVK